MKKGRKLGQLSLEGLLRIAGKDESEISFRDLARIIGELQRTQDQLKKREEIRSQTEKAKKEREERKQQELHIREVTCMDLPLAWENVFEHDRRAQGVHAETPADGLILSLNTLGRVDIEYISSVTGLDCKTVIGALKGSIYQNPLTWNECFYKGWETADEYLSGNLRRKWREAKKANEIYHGYFADNITALENAFPPAVPSSEIYVSLGSPWVPADIIDAFIAHILNDLSFLGPVIYNNQDWPCTKHDPVTGSWEIPNKRRATGVRATKTYGTRRINALQILEKTLNMQSICITDPTANGKKRVLNQSETVLALEKQKKMIEEFKKWVWTDDSRKRRLEFIFEDKFGCVRQRRFDGSFLQFPNLSPSVQLYPYQKNAVARILFTPNTLLAHDVGSGKTYIMIVAGMELLRMGLSQKNMFVVPNNLTGQWKDAFHRLYPAAKLLCVTPETFSPAKRETVLQQIRDESFDGILIAYSCFEQIPVSKNYHRDRLTKQQTSIEKNIRDITASTARLKKKQKAIRKALAELNAALDDAFQSICFDELGITRLFVDEAHNFKNVPFETQANVLGINAQGSKKCQEMLDKVHIVQRQNNGCGVVFATGTPITNSITDAYILQKYLQEGELTLLELQSFDSWAGMFAEQCEDFEIDVDTRRYRLATRFSKFHNLPELTALLASFSDFHAMDRSDGVPETDGYTDVITPKSKEFEAYLQDISDRVEQVRSGNVSRSEDNMLLITTDGRKAALDLRLVDPAAAFFDLSKVALCAENILNIYSKTSAAGSTQLVFCDTSTPKTAFNIYDELKRLLLLGGIRESEIAFVHDADSEAKRKTLFGKVRTGEVRVLVGSTFKLGLGVNVQDRLIALHHLDVPWRPADMTQREGRILRQGNTNSKVQIFRYITQGSFDAYSWQLLETKQRFIASLLDGSLTQRSMSDIQDTVLTYAEAKALAVGNPLIKKRVETANELTRLITLQKKAEETRLLLEKEAAEIPGQIERLKERISRGTDDLAFYSQWKETQTPPDANERKRLREELHQALAAHILETKERPLFSLCGFSVVLPTGMTRDKLGAWLQRSGRYYVNLSGKETGDLVRLEHALENLPRQLKKWEKNIFSIQNKALHIKEELQRQESFTKQIEACRKELKILDQKLGVNHS